MAGIIQFTLEYAKGVEDSDDLSSSDLYAVIIVGKQKTKSDVAKDGILQGFKYAWNQTFQFDVAASDDDVDVKLYDKDIGLDDFLGQASFPLSKARQLGTSHETVRVVTKTHEVKGSVTAKIEFERK